MWTDEELESGQILPWEFGHPDAKLSELYRLARLGLAAEVVGLTGFEEIADGDRGYPSQAEGAAYAAFLSHPAWRRD